MNHAVDIYKKTIDNSKIIDNHNSEKNQINLLKNLVGKTSHETAKVQI